MYLYFREKFVDAVKTDMSWTDEPDAMINMIMLNIEGENICDETLKIGLSEVAAVLGDVF